MSKSFVIHLDSLEILDELNDEQAGKLLKAFKDYHSGKEMELDQFTKVVFLPFKNQFIRDKEKYEKIVDRNRKNGLKGGRPKETEENPLGNSGNPEEPKKTNSVSDNDNVSRNESKKDINQRKLEFAESLKPFVGTGENQYTRDFVKEFYDYWSEHGPNDKKFRKEKQTSFDISRRLKTFFQNSKKFNAGSENRIDRLKNL
jgi:hypothetical protein